MGPIAHLGETETLRRKTERLQSHLGETEIPIGETEVTRVFWQWLCQLNSVAPDRKNRWVEIDFWFGTNLEVRKWLRALEHITKHFEQASH